MTTETTPSGASQDQSQTDAATPQEPDFDTLFAEAAAAKEGTTAQEAPPAEEPAVDLPDNAAQGEASPSEVDTSTPTAGESKATTEGNAPPKQEPEKPKAETPPADANAWRAALPPEAAKYLHDLEHKARSDAGRVSGLTKKLEQMSAAERERAKQKEAEREAFMAEFREKYPQIAEAVEKMVEPLRADAEGAKQLAEELAREEANRAQVDRLIAVETAHPGWKATIREPAFKQWLDSQSQGVKTLAASDEPGDAIALLDLFREKHPATSGASQEAAPAAKTSAPKPAPKTAAQVQAERKQKLAEAVDVPSSKVVSRESTTQSGGDPLEQAFDFFAAKKQAGKR